MSTLLNRLSLSFLYPEANPINVQNGFSRTDWNPPGSKKGAFSMKCCEVIHPINRHVNQMVDINSTPANPHASHPRFQGPFHQLKLNLNSTNKPRLSPHQHPKLAITFSKAKALRDRHTSLGQNHRIPVCISFRCNPHFQLPITLKSVYLPTPAPVKRRKYPKNLLPPAVWAWQIIRWSGPTHFLL